MDYLKSEAREARDTVSLVLFIVTLAFLFLEVTTCM